MSLFQNSQATLKSISKHRSSGAQLIQLLWCFLCCLYPVHNSLSCPGPRAAWAAGLFCHDPGRDGFLGTDGCHAVKGVSKNQKILPVTFAWAHLHSSVFLTLWSDTSKGSCWVWCLWRRDWARFIFHLKVIYVLCVLPWKFLNFAPWKRGPQHQCCSWRAPWCLLWEMLWLPGKVLEVFCPRQNLELA